MSEIHVDDVAVAERRNGGRLSVRGAAVTVGLLVFLVYCPVLGNGFVNWDDNLYVCPAPRGSTPTLASLLASFSNIHASGNWHPLTELSHAVDCAVWGMRPIGHHLTSILLHGLCAALVVALFCALARARLRSARLPDRAIAAGMAAGLLWGLHPLRVESAAWVSERKDLLCAAFYLLGLLSYLGRATPVGEGSSAMAHGQSRRGYMGALAWFVLALLSKPMAVSFPFVLLLLDGCPLARIERTAWWRLLAEKIPFFGLALGVAWVTLKAQQAGGAFRALQGVPAMTKVLVAVRAMFGYVGKTLWPADLLPLYTYPQGVSWTSWSFILPLVGLTLLAAGAVWQVRRNRAVLTLLACYVLTLLPVIGIVQVGPQPMADRYTYLPTVPLFLLVGAVCGGLWEKAAVLRFRWQGLAILLALALVPGALSWLSIRQMAVWRDSETLWSHVIRHEPWNTEAYNNRAAYYYDHGDYPSTLADYDAALSFSPPLGRAHAEKRRAAYFNDRAITYVRLGRLAEAVADESEAIRLRPAQVDYYLNRAAMLRQLGQGAAAAADEQRAQEIRAKRP